MTQTSAKGIQAAKALLDYCRQIDSPTAPEPKYSSHPVNDLMKAWIKSLDEQEKCEGLGREWAWLSDSMRQHKMRQLTETAIKFAEKVLKHYTPGSYHNRIDQALALADQVEAELLRNDLSISRELSTAAGIVRVDRSDTSNPILIIGMDHIAVTDDCATFLLTLINAAPQPVSRRQFGEMFPASAGRRDRFLKQVPKRLANAIKSVGASGYLLDPKKVQ